MGYLNCGDIAKLWDVSERSVRNYCASGRVIGAFLKGKTWMIPENTSKPQRQIRHSYKKRNLLDALRQEKNAQLKGGIYHKLQIELTYNSNHIEGSKLTHDQTKYIFEENTIYHQYEPLKIDDIVETINHFKCIDLAIDFANRKLSESFIKQLHLILKTNTNDSRKPWFKVGDYKMLENEVGGRKTTHPNNVKEKMKSLLDNYLSKETHTFEEIESILSKMEMVE